MTAAKKADKKRKIDVVVDDENEQEEQTEAEQPIADDLVWEEPPPAPPGLIRAEHGVWELLLAPLMENPGKWARVRTLNMEKALAKGAATVSNLRRGKLRRPAGQWEFVHRRLEPGSLEVGIWARYLGPEEEEDD